MGQSNAVKELCCESEYPTLLMSLRILFLEGAGARFAILRHVPATA